MADVAQEPGKALPQKDTGIRPIGDFISTIKRNGFAKHNHYTFTFVPPSKVDTYGDGSNKIDQRLLQLLCSSCTLPGVNIATSPHRTFGEQFEMPNDRTYGAITSTFYVDNQFHVKKLFDQWQAIIMDPTSRTFNFLNEYRTNIVIVVFDAGGAPHYKLKIEDAFPKSVNDVMLSHDSRDFMKIDVMWSYRRWTSELIENNVNRSMGDQINTEPKIEIQEHLKGYVGNFKDYQSMFNSPIGEFTYNNVLINDPNFGGYNIQNFGSAF